MNPKRDYFNFRSYYNIRIPLFLLFQITLPGIVLCFGTDGHVALENNDLAYCCESISISKPQSVLQTTNFSETTQCGDCIDVRISESSSEKKVVSSNALKSHIDMHAFVASVLSLPGFEETSINKTLIQASPQINQHLNSLQTTILIC